MNAESTVNNSSLTAEELQLIEAYRAKDFDKVVKVVGEGINAEEKRQQQSQEEHAIDLIAVEFVEVLDQTIDDLAYKLAIARGQTASRWAQEEAANDLLRELSQFLIQARLDPSDEWEAPMVKRHHLADPLFAHEWFGVSVYADGTLISVKED